MVLKGNNLEIKLGLVFYQISTQTISKWQNATLVQKKGNITTRISSQILKYYFTIILEALQSKAAV